jgi:peptidoglycan/LPS O-acetylase OafA/YrhL
VGVVRPNSGRHENRPLTALRGIAALWVVFHHAWPGWSGFDSTSPAGFIFSSGYVSVDIFFVLSGYILARVYADLDGRGTPMFYLRRICRVYPLHLAVLAVLVFHAATAPFLQTHTRPLAPHAWADLPAVALMLQSYLLDGTPWNPPTWSIGIELLAYALFPFGLMLMRRLPTWVLGLLVLGLFGAEHAVLRDHAGAIIGVGAVLRGLVGFFLGAVTATIANRGARPSAAAATAMQILAVFAMGFGVLRADPVPITLGSALLIAALGDERGLMSRVMSTPVLVWLGAISYSIYLLHVPLVIVIGRLHAPLAVRSAVLLLVLLPIATLTWRLIEQPGRRLPSRLVPLFQRLYQPGQQGRAGREVAP